MSGDLVEKRIEAILITTQASLLDSTAEELISHYIRV